MGTPATTLRELVAARARELGLARVGVASCAELPHLAVVERWLADGCAGELRFRGELARRAQPRSLAPEAQSAIVAALPCPSAPSPELAGRGRIARFAQRGDYHTELHLRLRRLTAALGEALGRPLRFAVAVDSAPLLERELAMAAGLGFIGKNTMLVAPGLGSHLVLGTLLVELPLAPDAPRPAGCGRCRLCLDACPTGALGEPFRVDARRCISYLTIEHRGAIAEELRGAIAPWLFGCDLCQEACPHNHPRADARLARAAGQGPVPALAALELAELLALSSTGYRRLVRGRALRRVDRAQLVRNAALCAGAELRRGARDPRLLVALERTAASFPNPVAAEAARWALDKLS